MNRRKVCSRATAVILIAASVAFAQTPYRLAEWVIDGGGPEIAATGGNYIQRGSFHQTTIGRAGNAAGNYDAWVGYWHPRQVTQVHDVGVSEILAPVGFTDTFRTTVPEARIGNYGTGGESFQAFFEIRKSGGELLYLESTSVFLNAGGFRNVEFPGIDFQEVGPRVARCSVYLALDENRLNDTASVIFKVLSRPPWPKGWREVTPMPVIPSNTGVKQGGWLTFNRGNGLCYAAKGNKTRDFYSYGPIGDNWVTLTGIPYRKHSNYKWARKPPRKGSKGVSDGDNYVYATQGNNTLAFWRYDVEQDSWEELPDVPSGVSGKKIKGGTDVQYLTLEDTGYVYLLKGYRTEFYRYNVRSEEWQTLADAPMGRRGKWDKGSWLVVDDDQDYLYAHKAKYHELWAFDIRGDSWQDDSLAGMPMMNPHTLRRKKSKDGGCGAWYDSTIFALKGGNTQEFWRYYLSGDSWQFLDTIPALGVTGRKKRVKYGADIEGFCDGVFYALKGNKTLEFWRYVASVDLVAPPPRRSGVMAGRVDGIEPGFSIVPSLLTGSHASLRYGLASPGLVRINIYDVTGRMVHTRSILGGCSGVAQLDLRSLRTGAYLVRIRAEGMDITSKLVIRQ